MTKYILAGGNDRIEEATFGPRLAAELHKSTPRPVRVLSCFFADPEGLWQNKAVYWEEWFKKYLGRELQYTLGSLEAFATQVRDADMVYLHGGESNELIVERMTGIADIPQLFEGKIVVGSSAGANYLSRKFWSRSRRRVLNGAGVLQYGVLVHYGSVEGDWGSAADWLHAEQAVRDAVGPSAQFLKLREGEFTVVET